MNADYLSVDSFLETNVRKSKINDQSDKKFPHKKVICRYGAGCTHINDQTHSERFWHPNIHTNEQLILSHHICNECGAAFLDINELQLHLKRKTAWSNHSLVGCKISCFVDYREWHEGVVKQFHTSGKHYVEFKLVGEKRWLNMRKVIFYIVERPSYVKESAEFKDIDSGDYDSRDLAPIEDNWVYEEDISVEYAFAQSMLFKIYGFVIQETGHKTRGHESLTEKDIAMIESGKSSLLYGELLPRGANKALSPKKLSANFGRCLFDLGMGTGKLAIQAFLQFCNLKYVYGIELSVGRFQIAVEAAFNLVNLLGRENFSIIYYPGKKVVVSELKRNNGDIINNNAPERILHLECGDMFDVTNIDIADIVMLETDFPKDIHPKLCKLLAQMREGSRTLTYLDLQKIWPFGTKFPFKRLESNRFPSDRFPTSWSVQRGHHFFIWTMASDDDSKEPVQYSGSSSSRPQSRSMSVSSDLPMNVNKTTQEGVNKSLWGRLSSNFLNLNLFSGFFKRKDEESVSPKRMNRLECDTLQANECYEKKIINKENFVIPMTVDVSPKRSRSMDIHSNFKNLYSSSAENEAKFQNSLRLKRNAFYVADGAKNSYSPRVRSPRKEAAFEEEIQSDSPRSLNIKSNH